MKDYTDIGLNKRLKVEGSITNRGTDFQTALEHNIKVESSPYLSRTAVQNRGGTLQVNLGGVMEVRDTTGGTILLTVDPDTGTVTIGGPVQANVTFNLGTISNTTLAGQGTIIGTINNTRLINNGTWNNGTLGTPAITGGTVNSVTMGTPTITGGVLNNTTFGTPAIIGGTHNSAVFGTPTLQTPTIDGTANFDVNTGSPALGVDGNFAIETHTGSAILVARVGGTTFYFVSAGTLA